MNDFELMELLGRCGYEQTAENLVALKEGLLSGDIELFEDIDNVELSDYELYQILEANGYKTTEDNLQILKEGLESGKYELCED